MGLFGKLKGEFIDIIEWLDTSNDTMIYRFDRRSNEIKYGAKLTVRESQVAVFINEGQVADEFTPGMYTLETQNIPILSTLKGWKHGFNSPFKAEVYFVNTKNFIDLKWGTKNPITLRDKDFGIVRLRAFGSYAIKIKNAVKFIKEIAGTDGHFTTDEINEQLKNIIMTRFTDLVGESKIPLLDMAANYNEFSEFVTKKIAFEFDEYGIEITKFLVENISLPKAVEEAIDKRASMGAVGNLDDYMKFQTAEAIEDAANNPGGTGEGIGMGMGFGMANQMVQSINQNQNQQNNNQQQTSPPPIPGQIQFFVAIEGQQQGPFNQQQLVALIQERKLTKESLIWKDGMANWIAAASVQEVNALFPQAPPPLPKQ